MATAITLKSPSGAVARIAPELGFNCYQFAVRNGDETVELLDFPDDYLSGGSRPSGYGVPILFPFPNRIRGGKFTWEEKDYQIPVPNTGANAIHGFCLSKPWRVVEQTENKLVGEFQMSKDDPERAMHWPADFVLRVSYELSDAQADTLASLMSWIEIRNPDNKTLPWGFGTHPYFRVPLAADSMPENCRYGAPMGKHVELKEFLPTGTMQDDAVAQHVRSGVTFGSTKFDDVFTDWAVTEGERVSWLEDDHANLRVNYVADPAFFRDLVVYTPPNRNAFCLEPYTCLTDAINLQAQGIDAGLQTLAPGQSVKTWLRLDVVSLK